MVLIQKINYKEIFTKSAKQLENGVDYHILWNKNTIDSCWFNYTETKIPANSLIVLNPIDVLHLPKGNHKLYQVTFSHINSHPICSLFLVAFCNQLNNQNSVYKIQNRETVKEIDHIIRLIKLSVYHTQDNPYLRSHNLIHLILQLICLKFFDNTDYKIEQFKQMFSLEEKETHFVKYHADYLNMSSKELLRRFVKKGYNKPSIVISNFIILEAKKKLFSTSLSVKEIGYELGFDDPAYFSRFFKKHTGISALEFKKNYQHHFLDSNSQT